VDFWDNFWNFVWIFFWSFAFIAYLPFLTALVYLIARGDGMARRSAKQASEMQAQTDQYIRQTAGAHSPADEIAKAKALLDAGTINAQEYEALKAKALSHA
jgi:hypothetical protein